MRFLRINVLVGVIAALVGLYLAISALPRIFKELLQGPFDWLNLLMLIVLPLAVMPGALFIYFGTRVAKKETEFEWRWIVGLFVSLAVACICPAFQSLMNRLIASDVDDSSGGAFSIMALIGLALYLRLIRWVLRKRKLGEFTDAELMPRVGLLLVSILLFTNLSELSRTVDYNTANGLHGLLTIIAPFFLAWAFYKIMIGLSRSEVNDNKAQQIKPSIKPAL